jgi:phosphatidylserine decarboxylase
VALAGLLFVLYFFRDPRRSSPEGRGLVLSPADGRVVDLKTVEDPLFPGGQARRLSIFLSIFDVHVNRAPVDGTVRQVAYSRGRFRAAFLGKASEDNERNRVDLDSSLGPVSVTQIAGAVARRIVCDVAAGDRVTAGERLGMIRFGSRVDLFLPMSAQTRVKKGDKVRTAATVLADFAPVEPNGRSVP